MQEARNNLEIERKFLVTSGMFKEESTLQYPIVQGFLSRDPLRTVRVRTAGDRAYLTVKSNTPQQDARREWEWEIPLPEAQTLLDICTPSLIRKIRYIIPAGNELQWEVDEFTDDNRGLVLAEIEIPYSGTEIALPAWIGKEVTGDEKYYNLYLAAHPYTGW